MRTSFILTLLAIFMAGTSCYAHSRQPDENIFGDWKYEDVRLIDPMDSTNVDNEIVAVLIRRVNETLKIRIDFLDLNFEQTYLLCVYIDTKPGGNLITEHSGFLWDYLIQYSSSGSLNLVDDKVEAINSSKIRVYKDLNGKFLELTIDLDNFPYIQSSARFLVSIKAPISNHIIDQTEIFFLNGSPPLPIGISFLFWNILDTSTPATMLRSWAGAHTGPQSSRHGFSYLLSAADTWHIPINVCGINDPDFNFALEYLQVWPEGNLSIGNGQMNTSELCNESALLASQRNVILSNQLSGDLRLFVSDIVDGYFNDNTSDVIVGGDLSKSILGSPETLEVFFSYITSHPWISVVNILGYAHPITEVKSTTWINELEANQIPYSITGIPIRSGLSTLEIQARVRSALSDLPDNTISRLARQIYEGIIESDQANIRLARGSYLSQLGHIIQASIWAETPREIYSCQQDIDWDGQPECILATLNTIMTFELDGGYLAFVFTINSRGAHQLIGSTNQFNVLRSDPSQIRIERGIAGDPGQVIGAFADQISSVQRYHVSTITPFNIEIVSQDSNIRKSFEIQNNIIHMHIIDNRSINITALNLPLVIDPWRIYDNFTSELYWGLSEDSQWSWGLADEVSVSIRSGSEYNAYTFKATYDALQFPEDPNYNYTLGHLFPVPMALVDFHPQSTISLDLVIDP